MKDYSKLEVELLVNFSDTCLSAYEQLYARSIVGREVVDAYLEDLSRLMYLLGQHKSEPI